MGFGYEIVGDKVVLVDYELGLVLEEFEKVN